MAALRIPGPIGLSQENTDLNDGTMIRALSPNPGSICGLARLKLPPVKANGPRLMELFAAVKATNVGAKFLELANSEPKLAWGNTGDFHGYFDGEKTIILNKRERTQLGDCQWKQVIAMELGNFANKEALNSIYDDGEKGALSKEDFVKLIEKIEFDSRNSVIDAYNQGEFGQPGDSCSSIFLGGLISFDEYFEAPPIVKHRAGYEDYWEKNCRKAYLTKNPR